MIGFTDAKNSTNTSVLSEPSTEKEEYEALMAFVNPIATPMAPRKLAKKLYKLVRKASKEKKHLLQGVVEVQRGIRRGMKGLVIIAGNISPIDVFVHIPGVCEELDLPYVYTPSKEHLGLVAGHKRPNVMLMVIPDPKYQELFDECESTISKLA